MEEYKTNDRLVADAAIVKTMRGSSFVNRGLLGFALAAGLTGAATQSGESLGKVSLCTTAAMIPIWGCASLGYRRQADKIIEKYADIKQIAPESEAVSRFHFTTVETKWCGVSNEEIIVENQIYDDLADNDSDMNLVGDLVISTGPYLLNAGTLVVASGLTSAEVVPAAVVLTSAVALGLGRELFLKSQAASYARQLDNVDGLMESIVHG